MLMDLGFGGDTLDVYDDSFFTELLICDSFFLLYYIYVLKFDSVSD